MSQNTHAEEDNDFKRISEVDYQKMENKLEKIGYAEGKAAGHESGFQLGFDKGYEDGFRTAFELEKYKSFFTNSRFKELKDEELDKEKDEYVKMTIPSSEDKEHCQYFKNRNESIEEISKRQQEYMNELLEKFRARLPIATNLLTK